eukprot:CAMPEP_0197857488 /NCGR_PEP_ID=MMETSP1438-20131217/30611_1 /TAXON_ID=1461541 /ORGANISM="Pterosperma sp., Strain CCMP1384" /LENGTH=215 /DNA_ID=CAMNT_0043473339 /DNA_START=53 /DNA_END=700 /DNA_ORIENTATION=+
MARLPPSKLKNYIDKDVRKAFEALDKSGGGRLSFAEIQRGLGSVDWEGTGLNASVITDVLQKESKRNGDKLVTFEEFWNFCLKNGTGHEPDPAEIAKEYLLKHRILPLFEMMTAALLYSKPDKPRTFLVEKLTKLKTGNGEAFFTDQDLSTMFSMFDITGKGCITVEQCNEALATLLGPGKDVRDSLGATTRTLSCDQFVKATREALAAAAPVPT